MNLKVVVTMTKVPTYNNFYNDVVRYKYLERVDKTPEVPTQSERTYAEKYVLRRSRSRTEESTGDKFKAATGAIIGTVIPLAIMMKKQKVKNPLKLKYDLPEMLILSATSIVGGVFCSTRDYFFHIAVH